MLVYAKLLYKGAEGAILENFTSKFENCNDFASFSGFTIYLPIYCIFINIFSKTGQFYNFFRRLRRPVLSHYSPVGIGFISLLKTSLTTDKKNL